MSSDSSGTSVSTYKTTRPHSLQEYSLNTNPRKDLDTYVYLYGFDWVQLDFESERFGTLMNLLRL
jgi:hypothetical protein